MFDRYDIEPYHFIAPSRGAFWFGVARMPIRPFMLDRRIAQALQAATLVGETTGFLAILSCRSQPFIRLLLIGFHIGQIAMFSWGFHANMLMLVLFFLPGDRCLERRSQPTRQVSPSREAEKVPLTSEP